MPENSLSIRGTCASCPVEEGECLICGTFWWYSTVGGTVTRTGQGRVQPGFSQGTRFAEYPIRLVGGDGDE